MNRFFRGVVRFPKTVILLSILSTLALSTQLKHVRFETDAQTMIPEDDEVFLYNEEIEDIFGVRDPIIVGIVNDNAEEDGIFNPRTLGLIDRISRRMLDIPGLVTIRTEDIQSLASMDNITGTEEGMEVRPFMEEVPETPEKLNALKEALFGNPTYVGWLVSEDGTAAAISAKMEHMRDSDNEVRQRADVYFAIRRIIDEEKSNGAPEQIVLAGRGAIEVTYGIYSSDDMRIFIPLASVLIIVILFLTYRSVRGVAIPFFVVATSVLWAFSLKGLVRVPMYFISTMEPVILLAVGVADGIHILGRYYDEILLHPNKSPKEIVLATMNEMWAPVVMTSLTTAAGFMSLLTVKMLPLRHFGIFTAVGILVAMVFSLTFIPAALVLLPAKVTKGLRRQMEQTQDLRRAGVAARFLNRFGQFVFRHSRPISVAGLALVLLSSVGIFLMRADTSWIGNFEEGSDVRVADTILREKFQGTLPLNVIFEGTDMDQMKRPEILLAMDRLQETVEKHPKVGGSVSIAEYVKRINRVMNEDRLEMEVVPDSYELIYQYLEFYSGDPDDFQDWVDSDYQLANLWVFLRSDHTQDVAEVVDVVNRFIEENSINHEGLKVRVAGLAYISLHWVDLLISGQIQSLIVSIITVSIITALMFRSATAGLYCIVPVGIATLFNFGFLGLIGIPLDVSNALNASIIIGIGVDYTIHFIAKYRLKIAQGMEDLEDVTVETMVTAGKAIFFNAIVVIGGFLVFLTSHFPPHVKLGFLIGLNMFVSFLGAVTILPALINRFRPGFIFNQVNRK